VKKTGHEIHHYVIFSTIRLPPFWVKISSTLCSQKPSVYVTPPKWQTKFRTHTAQLTKLQVLIWSPWWYLVKHIQEWNELPFCVYMQVCYSVMFQRSIIFWGYATLNDVWNIYCFLVHLMTFLNSIIYTQFSLRKNPYDEVRGLWEAVVVTYLRYYSGAVQEWVIKTMKCLLKIAVYWQWFEPGTSRMRVKHFKSVLQLTIASEPIALF
jgi:hypothetical protein